MVFRGRHPHALHSGDNATRRGNDVETPYGIAPGLNLHSIWDDALAERAITAAEPPLVRRYAADERPVLAGGGPGDWGSESWELRAASSIQCARARS